jgi:hypothetical protein
MGRALSALLSLVGPNPSLLYPAIEYGTEHLYRDEATMSQAVHNVIRNQGSSVVEKFIFASDPTDDQIWALVRTSTGREGRFYHMAREANLSLSVNGNVLFSSPDYGSEPEVSKRTVKRTLAVTDADRFEALCYAWGDANTKARSTPGWSVPPLGQWLSVNHEGKFGRFVVAELGPDRQPTGNTTMSEPTQSLSGIESRAEIEAWRKLLGLTRAKVSEILGTQTAHTFMEKLTPAIAGQVDFTVDQAAIDLSAGAYRSAGRVAGRPASGQSQKLREILEARKGAPAAAAPAAAPVAAAPVSPVTVIQTGMIEKFGSVLLPLTQRIQSGEAEMADMVEYMELSKKVASFSAELAAFYAKYGV